MQKHRLDVTHWLKPIKFLDRNFRIIYHPQNLAYDGKQILIRADKLPKNRI